ncbi:hypothetical protein ACFL3S_00695 [Gemmatimonadota bacterium]
MVDLGERIPLDPLDPGMADPGFWIRFHARVMEMAESELARRRMAGDLSVAEVVFAWRKALVPLSLMAAALAGVLLFQPKAEEPLAPLALEEALTGGLEGDPIPVVLAAEAEMADAAYLVPGEGF